MFNKLIEVLLILNLIILLGSLFIFILTLIFPGVFPSSLNIYLKETIGEIYVLTVLHLYLLIRKPESRART